MRADVWTAERLAALKLLWSEGQTGEAIARRFGGVSRSAVLGKIFRLRLAAVAAAAKAEAAAAPPAAAPPTAVPITARPQRRRSGKSLIELKNESCRWPFGHPGTPAFFFCGEPGADLERGMPYCPRHARRAYRSDEPPARRGRPACPDVRPPAVPPREKIRKSREQKFDGRSAAR